MPKDEDLLFLRSAVEAGLLEQAMADQVLAALEQVEQLGASSCAREIAVNRGLLRARQADRVLSACGLRAPTPARSTGRIGNFRLLERLGVGGMGVVYKARQVTMDRLVALKILPPRSAKDRSFVERFIREARSAARLNHPNIVQGIDVGEADGVYYFAMELVEGESLRERIRRLGRISQGEALGIARQVALALEHANAHNIIHRDIKPDNILLTRNGTAKLADLGLAKRPSDLSVTQPNAQLGTPLYMSPEQARGQSALDTRSDIYSLGATLYHAVVGSPPFTSPNAAAVITKHLFEKPPWPRDAVPELTEGFCNVLMKMLAKKPAARYQSPTQLLEDVNRLIQGRVPIRAVPRATPPGVRRARRRKRRSPLVPIFATTSVFILTVGGWLLYTALAGATEQPGAGAARAEPRALQLRRAPRQPHPARRADPGRKALAELERVRKWVKAKEPDPKVAIRNFRSIAGRYPNTPAAEMALREAEKLQREIEGRARRALEEVCQQAKRLAAKHQFAEAVELLDNYGNKRREWLDEVSEARGFVLSDAIKMERALRGRAQELARKSDFAAAIALYQQIVQFGIPKLAARARREVRLLEEQLAAAERKARQEAEASYLALRLKLAPLLEKRQYAEARKALAAALDDAALAPVGGELEADARDLDAIDALWTAAERGARTLRPKEEFSVGGIRGAFVEYADGAVHVRASGLLVKKSLCELSANEIIALATRKTPGDEPIPHLACALFLLAEGKLKAAERAFAKDQEGDGDAKRYPALIERRRADLREAEAETLFARAADLLTAENWQRGAEALDAYRKRYANTRSFARRERQAEDLALRARLGALDVADLFHGECRPTNNSRKVELTYDFSEPEQLADWDLRGTLWELNRNQLVLQGAQALLRAPTERDLQATVELADATGPPGQWALALAETIGAPPAYTFVLPERVGMPAVLRDHQRQVARGPMPHRVNQPRKLALALRSQRLALAAKDREVLSWRIANRDAPPQLRLGIGATQGRAVRVGSVRLVAPISKQWAADELARLRARLQKRHALARTPPRSLFSGATLEPWAAEHGAWEIRDGAATTSFGGKLALRKGDYEDLELRVKVRPSRANSVVRVCFRVAAKGDHYSVVLGREAADCRLALHQRPRGPAEEALARFAERVDWKPGQWYDLRILAVGSELRVELDGALLCLVRDDRRHGGALSLDVVHGGAVFKDIALRALDQASRPRRPALGNKRDDP